jgi:hypothetical protein
MTGSPLRNGSSELTLHCHSFCFSSSSRRWPMWLLLLLHLRYTHQATQEASRKRSSKRTRTATPPIPPEEQPHRHGSSVEDIGENPDRNVPATTTMATAGIAGFSIQADPLAVTTFTASNLVRPFTAAPLSFTIGTMAARCGHRRSSGPPVNLRSPHRQVPHLNPSAALRMWTVAPTSDAAPGTPPRWDPPPAIVGRPTTDSRRKLATVGAARNRVGGRRGIEVEKRLKDVDLHLRPSGRSLSAGDGGTTCGWRRRHHWKEEAAGLGVCG